MKFSYYYGNQADQFSFIRIPRLLLKDPLFGPLTLQAKMLYGVLLDRMSLSMRNGWYDELNRVYIIYQISEIQEDLGFSHRKAIDHLAELEKFGLVEKKRRGRGLPSILYIKSFMVQAAGDMPSDQNVRSVNSETSAVINLLARNDEIRTSEPETDSRGAGTDISGGAESALQEVPDATLQEVRESTPLKSYNNINYIHQNHIESNPISSAEDEMRSDGMKTAVYLDAVREQIEYEILCRDQPYDQELIDGIVDIMLEVKLNQSSSMLVASAAYPTQMVRERFAKLTFGHVQYVLDCFNGNTTRIGNIKKYLMTALFNAPSTISGYYTAAVHHDMPYLAGRSQSS